MACKINGQLAIMYYYMYRDFDSNLVTGYNNLPHILTQMRKALDVKVEIPKKIGWGDAGKIVGKINSAVLSKYRFNDLIESLNPFFHVVIYSNRIEIIGTDLCRGATYTINCNTGVEIPAISVGYRMKGMHDKNRPKRYSQLMLGTSHIDDVVK